MSMQSRTKTTNRPRLHLFQRSATAFALLITGIVCGSLAGNLPWPITLAAIGGAIATVLSAYRPDVALYTFFCGIIMTSDAVSLSTEGCFVIPDVDIIQGLPSALTTFFLMLFGITMIRIHWVERRPMPISSLGLGLYIAVLLLALLTGLVKNNSPMLLRIDLMNMLFPVLCFYLCIIILNSRERIKQMMIVLLAVSVLKALILSLFYLIGRGWIYQLDSASPFNIVTLDSADLLAFITLFLVIAHLLVRREIRGAGAVWAAAACIPLLFAVIFSYRRAQWIGLVLSLGLLYLASSKPIRYRITVMFSIVLCTGLFITFTPGANEDRLSRITARFTSIFDKDQPSNLHHKLETQQVIRDLTKSPLLGFGLGGQHSGFVEEEYNGIPTNIVHQTFLYIWMKTGLPGLLFFTWAAFMYAKNILRIRKTHLSEPVCGLILPLAASSGLWLAMFLTSPIPWYLHQTYFKALVAAIIMALVIQTDRDEQTQPEELS